MNIDSDISSKSPVDADFDAVAGDSVSSVSSDVHDHEAAVRRAREAMPDDDCLMALSDLYKVFGDSTRLRILTSLFGGRLCVGAIAEVVGMSQTAVSHQLKVLKESRLVDCARKGKTVYYFLADDHVSKIIGQGYEHVSE